MPERDFEDGQDEFTRADFASAGHAGGSSFDEWDEHTGVLDGRGFERAAGGSAAASSAAAGSAFAASALAANALDADAVSSNTEALGSVLGPSASDDGFVVFERGAAWPPSLSRELAGRRGVVVMVQQPGESHDGLLSRVRQRANRLSEPVGHLVWVGSSGTRVRWEELLRALFATDEFGPQCLFSAYCGDVAAVLGLAYEEPREEEPARPSYVRSTRAGAAAREGAAGGVRARQRDSA